MESAFDLRLNAKRQEALESMAKVRLGDSHAHAHLVGVTQGLEMARTIAHDLAKETLAKLERG